MSGHNPTTHDCRNAFLEWIGATRRDLSGLPFNLQTRIAQAKPTCEWFYLYRCPNCGTVVASPVEPRVGPAPTHDKTMGAMDYEIS